MALTEKLSLVDQRSDEEMIWDVIRAWLTISRIVVFFAVIIVSEFMEEFMFLEITIAIWALVIGIPLFLLISVLLIIGDKRYAPEKDEARKEATAKLKQKIEGKTAVKRPIKARR